MFGIGRERQAVSRKARSVAGSDTASQLRDATGSHSALGAVASSVGRRRRVGSPERGADGVRSSLSGIIRAPLRTLRAHEKRRPKPPLERLQRPQYVPTLMSLVTDTTPLVFLAMETALSASACVFALPVNLTTPLSVSTWIFNALTCLSTAKSALILVVIAVSERDSFIVAVLEPVAGALSLTSAA